MTDCEWKQNLSLRAQFTHIGTNIATSKVHETLHDIKDTFVTFKKLPGNSVFGSSGRAAAEAQPERFRVYVTEASRVG